MRTEDIYCTHWLQIIWSCSNNCCLLPCRPDKCILRLIGGGAQRNDRTSRAHYENGRSQRPFLCLIVLMNPRWAHLPACLCQPAWILQFCIQRWDLIQSFLWPYISWNIFKWSYAQVFILQINNVWMLLGQCCNEIFYQSLWWPGIDGFVAQMASPKPNPKLQTKCTNDSGAAVFFLIKYCRRSCEKCN